MSDNQPKRVDLEELQLAKEIRDGRKFSLAEAIGRMGGPGMLKGESPATHKQQAEAKIESF